MPSPFPGMDPYLEDPELWPDVHHELISVIREKLNSQLRPRYVARVELRVYMESDDDPNPLVRVPDIEISAGRPGNQQRSGGYNGSTGALTITTPVIISSDPIEEARIEILEVSNKKLVTVIEILSPTNKRTGNGRNSFLEKRAEVLQSSANWLEIDLLRDGSRSPGLGRFAKHPYLVFSSPYRFRTTRKYWPIKLEDRLPVIGIPLKHPDPEAPLDLQAALETAYDRGAYDLTIDYTKPANPPMTTTQAKWAKSIVKKSRS